VQQLTALVTEAPAEPAVPAVPARPADDVRLGLVLAEIGLIQRHVLRVDDGLSVREVRGAAARAGIQVDDVIAAVSDQPVGDLAAFDAALAACPADRSVALLVVRGGAFGYVTVTPRH
jgi:serine protease Do